ncbi:MAG: HEAT repeat domain-containing protein [Planctomycetaceae bacterium]
MASTLSLKNCSQCGSENLAAAKFCSDCGRPFAFHRLPVPDTSSGADQLQLSQERWDPGACIEGDRRRLKSSAESIPKPSATAAAVMRSLESIPESATEARIALIQALGETRDPGVLRTLLLSSSSRFKEIRKATAIALSRIRHPLACYLLLPLLKDKSSRVRSAALQALLNQRNSETLDSIVASCLSEREQRMTARDALNRLRADQRDEFAAALQQRYANSSEVLLLCHELTAGLMQRKEAAAETSLVSAASENEVSEQHDSEYAAAGQPDRTNVDHSWELLDAHGEHQSSPAPVEAEWNRRSSRDRQLESAGASIRSRSENQRSSRHEHSQQELNDDSYADLSFFESLSTTSFTESRGNGQARRSSDDRGIPVSSASSTNTASMNLVNTASGELPFAANRPAPSSWSSVSQMASGSESSGSAPAQVRSTTSAPQMAQMSPGTPSPMGMPPVAPAVWPAPPLMIPTIVPVPQYLQPPFAGSQGHYASLPQDALPALSTATQQTSSDTIHRITLPPAEPEAPVISQTPAAPPPVIATETDESAEKDDQERRLQRLRDARDKAFRQLLKLEEEPIPAVPRLLSRRIATLLSTPSKQHDKICEQLEELGKSAHTSVIETISSFTHKPVKEVRLACARALGHIRHSDSSVQLLKMLGDKSGTVAEAALKSLLSQPLKELYPVILSAGLVTSGMKAIVVSGIESLESDQKSAWEQFFLTVQSTPDQELQAFALSLLARITGSAHYELFRTLVSHEAAELRAAAIEAMARTEEKRSMSHINEGLQDVDPEVRNQAVLALNVMHSPRSIELLSKLFTDPVVSVRRNAAIVASRIEEEGLADAAAAALDRERDPDTVEALLACLSRNAATVGMNVLTQYAEDRQSPFRDLAIRALRKQKNPESIPAFVRLLDDLSSAVRRQAVEHLGAVRHIPVATQIRELLKRDPDETVRAACAKALGDFGDAGSLQPLEEALEDHALVRLQAVIALGRLGQAAAAPSLLSLFADAQPEIRYQAVRAIGALKLDDTIRHVEPLLDDKDELVRRGAEQTLTELGVPVSFQKRQRLKKRLIHLAVNFIPPYLAGSIPGGGGALLATVATVLLLSVSWGLMKIKSVTAAEDFHIGPVASVALNPDASQLAVTRSSGVMELWKTDDGTLQYRVSAPKDANRLFFDKSGAILYAAGKQIVRKTDAQLKEGQEGQSIELPSAPAAVVQHSQSDSLYVFLRSGNGITLRKIACETLKDVGQFALDKPYKGLCLVSPDEAMAAMVDPDGNLNLFDLKTGKSATVSISRMTKQKRLGRVRTVIFSLDMKHIAISAEDMGLVVLDLKSLKLLKHVTKRGIADYIDGIFPDENTLLCVATDGAVLRLSNNFADEDLSQVKGLPNAEIVSIAANQKSVAIGHPEEKNVWILSVAEKKIAREIAPEDD